MAKENSLEHSPVEDQVPSTVERRQSYPPERVLFSLGTDYHRQLETYGSLIRQVHHARTSAAPLMGWWSSTAYSFGLNDAAALTNAQWETEHLRSFGYNIFHIDEGYDYARGDHATPNATLFPRSSRARVTRYAARPGSAIWTTPFEVSERSWCLRSIRIGS